MKKITALVLAMMLLAASAAVAFADTNIPSSRAYAWAELPEGAIFMFDYGYIVPIEVARFHDAAYIRDEKDNRTDTLINGQKFSQMSPYNLGYFNNYQGYYAEEYWGPSQYLHVMDSSIELYNATNTADAQGTHSNPAGSDVESGTGHYSDHAETIMQASIYNPENDPSLTY